MYILNISSCKVKKRWKKRWMCKWTIGYCSLRNASPLSITCENKAQTDTVLYKINAFQSLLSCFTHLQSGRVSEYVFPHQTRKQELWFLPCMEIHWVGLECFFVNRRFIETNCIDTIVFLLVAAANYGNFLHLVIVLPIALLLILGGLLIMLYVFNKKRWVLCAAA